MENSRIKTNDNRITDYGDSTRIFIMSDWFSVPVCGADARSNNPEYAANVGVSSFYGMC